MKIEIVSMWYDEEFLAPFFLNHYSFADKIHLIIDTDTTDKSANIALTYPNVEVQDFTFPEHGIDEGLKMSKVAEVANNLNCDWVCIVDADEFLFSLPDIRNIGSGIRRFLQENNYADVIIARMWNVWRNKMDKDLDPDFPPLLQRRNGDPDTMGYINKHWIKPIVIRPKCKFGWTPGGHQLYYEGKIAITPWHPKVHDIDYPIKLAKREFEGVHWGFADPNFCVDRKLLQRLRQSSVNIKRKWVPKHCDKTREELLEECEKHKNDPQLF